jgi:hypothetical protein
MTPYTSFLVVEEGEAREFGLHDRRREFEAAKSGRGAVGASRTLSEAKDSAAPAAPRAAEQQIDMAGGYGMRKADKEELAQRLEKKVKQAGGKTYLLNVSKGVYYDSTYDEAKHGKPREIQWFSDEFFKLVREHPEIKGTLQDVRDMVIVVAGKAYRFVE